MTRKLFTVLVLVVVLFATIVSLAEAGGGGQGKGQGKGSGKTEEHGNSDHGGGHDNGNHSGQDKGGSSGEDSGSDGSSEADTGEGDAADSSEDAATDDAGGDDAADPGDGGSKDDSAGESDAGQEADAPSKGDGGGSKADDGSGPKGNGNTGSSKTRKGLNDPKQNQNIYQEGDVLSYHVTNRHPGENTIIVKKPGKNGEIVFQTTVTVGDDGVLNVELTDIPEDWSGVYQVQIWDEKGMKNDNINIKRKHVVGLPDEPGAPEEPDMPAEPDEPSTPSEPGAPEEPESPSEPEDTPDEPGVPDEPESTPETGDVPVSRISTSTDDDDCLTVVYHASTPEVTVVEFFRPEHARQPWMYEAARLGESRVDTEGAVVAQFAGGVTFVVFEYDEATGAYNYRGTGEVIGSYDELVHIWSDGDATSVLFNALVWTPVGATK